MIFRLIFLRSIAALIMCLCSAGSWSATYGYAQTPLAWINNTTHTDVTWGGAAQCAAWNSAPVDDDGTAPINIGFTFNFGATGYTQVRVNSNGRLQFNNNYCGYGTQAIGPPPTYPYPYPDANMNNTMRIYGADFCAAGGGAGCSGRVTYAALGLAPNRSFVITWSQMREWNSGTSLFNVQVILYESGDFVYQYKDIANVSQGAGQVGWQISAADYGLVDLTTVNSLAYTAVRFYKPTAPIAEYRLDECSGTTASDSSGSGYNGTLAGAASVAGTGQICTAYNFDGSTGYVGLPASFPKLGNAAGNTSFTVTAWINSSSVGKSGQRILVDDQNNTGGYAISLGDGGSGTVRFFSRAVSPVIFDSPAVITNNTWYFVVAMHDAAAKTRTLMIYDAGGGLLSNTSQTYTGTWGVDAGTVAIGGENAASTENSSGFRFVGRIDELLVFNRVLALTEITAMASNEGQGLQRDGALRLCAICNATLGAFNAFDTVTAAGSVTGVIRTKIAGATFAASSGNIDVVSLSGGVLTNFNGNTTVQFLDASNNSGAMDAKGCRPSWSVITTDAGLAAFTLNFPNVNRVSMPAKSPLNSWPEVRVKVFVTATPTTNGCSSDAFAIRPSYISTSGASARDADWQTSGNSRTLNNQGVNGGAVHAAGKPFSLSGLVANNTANNATTNYAGSPTLVPGNLVLPDPSYCATNGFPCIPGTFNVTSWTYLSGALSSTTASYSEAGVFSWEVEDRNFANVDAGDSLKGQRYFRSNAVIYTGRFVPASYQVNVNAPVLQTFGSACATRSFTYMGQPFGYSTPPIVTVTAVNGAATPATTLNYLGTVGSGGIWKLATPLAYNSAVCVSGSATCATTRQNVVASPATTLTTTYTLSGASSPGWINSSLSAQPSVPVVNNNNGSSTLTYGSGENLTVYRNTPQVPFAATVNLALQLSDYSESAVAGNPGYAGSPAQLPITGNLTAMPIVFDSGNTFNYGRLKLSSAYGSELLPLQIPVQAEIYNGTTWLTNTADFCTAIPANAVAVPPLGGQAVTVASAVTLIGGKSNFKLTQGATKFSGNINIALNLAGSGPGGNDKSCITWGAQPASSSAALPWLQFPWCATGVDPNARANFGTSKAPYLYLRERY